MQGDWQASRVSKSASAVIHSTAVFAFAAALVSAVPHHAAAQTINCGGPAPFGIPPAVFAAGCATASGLVSLTAAFNTANTVFLTHTGPFVGSPPGAPNSAAGGVWIRGIGGSVDNTATGTISVAGSLVGPLPSAIVPAEARTNYAGVQGGVDIARLNMGASGWNGHVGLTGGYMTSNASARTGIGGLDTDVPFFGVYGVLTHTSGFFSDVMVRWDWYSNSISNATVGLIDQKFDADGVSVTGTAGYRFSLPQSWFIEPSAGFVWSRVDIDNLAIPGGGPFGIPSGTASFSDSKSLLGRLGVRVGTTFSTPTVALQPFVAANVWHEFEDASSGNVTCVGCPFTAINVVTTRVGTYGQYGLGLVGQVLNTGWLGYLRVDYRNGDHIDGWGINGGLRYQWQDAAAPSPALIRK